MAIDFDLLTLDELHELALAHADGLLPDRNWSQLSVNWSRLRAVAGLAIDIHAHVDQSERNALPDEAEGARIDKHGDVYQLSRLGASGATGAACAIATGTAGASITTSDYLVSESGIRYQPDNSYTVGAAGTVTIGLVAIDAGEASRLVEGDALTWESPPLNVEDEVVLIADMVGGVDAESDGAYQARLLDRIGQGARGGSNADWHHWVLEAVDSSDEPLNLSSAYIYPNRNGLNTVDVCALFNGEGSARIPTVGQRTDLLAYLQTKAPLGCVVRVLEPTAETVDVDVALYPDLDDASILRDWDDSTPLVVSSYTSATRTIVFTTDRPPSMQAGHRLTVEGFTGEQLVIESLSGANAVVISEELYTPAGTEAVYSGGALVEPVRASIKALIDSLGPLVGDFGVGDWVGTLYESRTMKAVVDTDGVLNVVLVAPGTDTAPTDTPYPDDAAVNFLIAGEVLVRYA